MQLLSIGVLRTLCCMVDDADVGLKPEAEYAS